MNREERVETKYLWRGLWDKVLPANTLTAVPIRIFGIVIGMKVRLLTTHN